MLLSSKTLFYKLFQFNCEKLDFFVIFAYANFQGRNFMGFLSSVPFLSFTGSAVGISVSMLLTAIMLALWALILMILHPLHATIFVISAIFEYAIIYLFGFHLWADLIAFFVVYILIFGLYTLLLRKWLPLPKSEVELLIKLSQLKTDNLISEEEYKAAKKRLLKL